MTSARDDDDPGEYLARMIARATAAPLEVEARIHAAYACDRYGTEEDAVVHYDAAWQLGVPQRERRKFMLGYGSTLRNVGRLDEALAVLGQAVEEFPDYPALHAFLALALHSAGEHRAAVATLIGVALDLAEGTPALDGYERALAHYHQALLEESVSGKR